ASRGKRRGGSAPTTAPPGTPRGSTPPRPPRGANLPAGTNARQAPASSPGREDRGPSLPVRAAGPDTLPSPAVARARNSGCAQLTTTLVFASTELTIPTSPSGLTTADKGFTPWFFPADTMKLRALDGSGSCSTSAGT